MWIGKAIYLLNKLKIIDKNVNIYTIIIHNESKSYKVENIKVLNLKHSKLG